ncbi:MAG: hypothetical protein A4E69_00860 [Syntrophus sp. PtaB.Bin138]|nr:MAG: hypothetical protein A4E69_00860 [Syntrophus sp. PtaB.Bin138]
MLAEQLIGETFEMQGFRIESVKKAGSELVITIVHDLRYQSLLRGVQQSRRLPGYTL